MNFFQIPVDELKENRNTTGLVKLLVSPDWMRAVDAAEALAQLGDARGLGYLHSALQSEKPEEREVAAEILETLDYAPDRELSIKTTTHPPTKKTCHYCSETIPAETTRCPACRKRLTRNKRGRVVKSMKEILRPWIAPALAICGIWLAYSGYGAYLHFTILREAQTAPVMTSTDLENAEECAIYQAIIQSEFLRPTTELVLVEQNHGFGFGLTLSEDQKPWELAPTDETWRHFISQNQSVTAIQNCFVLDTPHLLVESSRMEDLNFNMNLAGIKRTPFLQFSRIGLSSTQDEAVVHVSVTVLGRTRPATVFAFGYYVLLKKEFGEWKIIQERDTFIT